MPRFQIDIQKRIANEFWTNVYYCEAADISAAGFVAQAIADAERTFHSSVVTFDVARARSVVEDDDVYVTVPLGSQGLVSDSTGLMPLFNTLNVDFAAETGRPSRKYYRGVLHEGDVNFDQVANNIRNVTATNLNGLITSLTTSGTPLVDVDGDVLTNAIVKVPVGMRQLRRGSKRRQQPILTP